MIPERGTEWRVIGDQDDIRDFDGLLAVLEETVGPGNVAQPAGYGLEAARLRRLARMVCRIDVGSRPAGTGVLVGPDRLLTARHVLPSSAAIDSGRAVFGYRGDGKLLTRFRLVPDQIAEGFGDLDAVVVRIAGAPGQERGYVPFSAGPSRGAPRVGDSVFVIQHPAGRPLAIVIDDTEVVETSDTRFQYRADTSRGSSGSPVFLRHCYSLAGIHVRGGMLPRLDGEGAHWINEGLLASRLSRIAGTCQESCE